MQDVNYIKHLNAVFLQFSKDGRLNPTHISLYVALFQLWNNYHFPDNFHINREEVMQFSKIGSKTTYHRCIKELHHWKYLVYEPSHNPFHGSKIKMFNFGTSDGQALYPNPTNIGTSFGQAVVSINKHIQTVINNTNGNKLDQPKSENEVIDFFQKENWPELEAKKFYNHYQGIGWKVGGKTKIIDWQATARNWMLKADVLKTEKTVITVSQNTDNLKTSSNKNYSEPL
ncbi:MULTISPECIES: hypothetical protein [Flagellimonas]|uniref:Transcriptional regulator n=2 Tax=Flagellimonas TaxID=444459 RepID=A0ABT5XRM8_9FLAO|nr:MULTISPECIES: hypothetical protein [Allomuricauda]MBO0356193.1 hypothetical protein [Allomuricauda aurea]MDF0708558.1 hypothetical protein [[Muricauda] okinawensis]